MKKSLLFIMAMFVVATISAQMTVWSGGKPVFSPDKGVKVDSITFVHTEIPPTELSFNKMEAKPFGNNWALTFTETKTETVLNLDVYGPKYKFMPEGKYVFGAEDEKHIGDDVKYTNFKRGEENITIKECEMNVTVDINAAIYTIVGTITAESGEKFTLAYVGKAEGMPIFDKYEVNFTVAKRAEANPQTDGRYYLKFNDKEWTAEMTIDFYADPTTEVLPAGAYTIGDTQAAGTINAAASNIALYAGHPISGAYFKSGKVDVAITTEGKYSFTLDVVDVDGQGYIGTFTLDVADMKPEAQTVDYTFESLSANIYTASNWALTFKDTKSSAELFLEC